MTTYAIMVDTAGSWDGAFPAPTSNCYCVDTDGPDGPVSILVSSRYTSATDHGDAAVIAIDALHEWTSDDETSYPVVVTRCDGSDPVDGTVTRTGDDWIWEGA